MKRLGFLLCTALGISLFVLKRPVGVAVLGFCVLCFLLSACENMLSRKKLFALVSCERSGLKNVDIPLKLTLTGSTGDYSGRLRLKNMLTGQTITKKLSFTISGGKPAVVDITLNSETCGKISADIMSLKAFDLTGLVWKRVKCEVKGSVNIMPDAAEIDESEEAMLKEALESDIYSEENEGTDHSEPIGIREYRQGDSYKSVHWKLSFRLGDIYVREYGEPVTDSLCIYIETGGSTPPEDYDRLAAKALSLSMALSEDGTGHYMAFYSFSQQRKIFEHIDSSDSFAVALDSLLSSQPEQGKEHKAEFSELFEKSGISRVIEIK
ncbi:DUF58 domain-containing protein [uncultured Ruminococcus sp.]|uniref:DUF58 domain-containing protein n=1 Tax=uncultured Ruminococcus sp. TaxID=165186 RepID=UPI0025DA4065|nr:DUF58 domain-containing protein [uncultured Ruminococcus sp.]